MRALYGALASPVNRKVGIFHKSEKYRPASAQRGNTLLPIRNLSTACAHCRPSRMAHTTSDCPLRMSPQENTPDTLDLSSTTFAATFPRGSRPTPDCSIRSEEHTSELQSLLRRSYDVFR